MNTPTRPVMRYHGGKWRLAPWIIQHFPAHRIYVEPFGGAGSVLLQKPRAFAEVYNDLDSDVVNLFRVLRDPEQSARLRVLLELTPWARDEFYLAYEPTEDPVEGARRTIVRAAMAFGSTHRRKNRTGFRGKAYRQNQTGAMDWCNYPPQLVRFLERLRGVTIENRDALDIIAQQDTAQTLFYVDPPYPHSTRSSILNDSARDRAYAHELTDEDHRALATALRNARGMVVLSGYPCALYDELYPDWRRAERAALADGARKRTEVLWINPAAAERLQPTLFDHHHGES